MIVRDCTVCAEPFEARHGNQHLCGDTLCLKINVLRGQKRSTENRLAPLEAQLAERKAERDRVR